ncbi:MAG: M28 family peptidase, partial [Thermoproteales archaeon]|nr:M28 family peptidase [Thermoproteales archaeon]
VKFTLEKLNELKKEGAPISIEIHSFNTTIPYNNFAYIEIKGLSKKIDAYSLYPNLVALGGTVNLTGKLIYVKDGSYQYINGKPIANNIILIDFNSGKKWLDLVALGAKAVIFIAPEDTTRIEAEKKVTLSPLDIPRLYVDKEAAKILVEAANKGLTVSVTNICTWKQVEAYNIIVKYNGTENVENPILITAHLDTISIIPKLAPGAEEAINPSILLSFIEQLKKNKPKYSIWFVFFSGHWQGLSGPRYFVEEYIFHKNLKPYVVLNLDLSSSTSQLVIYPGGLFYGHRTQGALNLYRDFRTSARRWIKEFYDKDRELYQKIKSEAYNYNATTGIITEKSFETGYAINLAKDFILDAEPFGIAKILSVSYLTYTDLRLKTFTPFDTPDNINWENIKAQLSFVAFSLNHILSDIKSVYTGSLDSLGPTRIEVDPINGGFGYATVSVEVLEYNPTVPTLYVPVPKSLVVVHKVTWYYNTVGSLGVTTYNLFSYIVQLTDDKGTTKIIGMAPQEVFIGNIEVVAYKVNNQGRLIYVPDMGSNGAGKFSFTPPHLKDGITVKTVAFKAAGLLLPYLAIPDQPWELITLNIYRKPYYAVPYTHYSNPVPVSIDAFYENLVRPDSHSYIIDYENKFALVFAPPNKNIEVMGTLTGLGRKAILLINLKPGTEEGIGYKLGDIGTLKIIPFAIHHYVRELFTIADLRYERAISRGIRDSSIERLINQSKIALTLADKYYNEKIYDKALVHTFRAWSYTLELYERMRTMYVDFTNAVLFIMLIIAPFAIIAEKLVGLTGGFKRLLIIVLVSLSVFAIFAILHPGFSIVYSISALSLGVILLILSIPTVFFLFLIFSRSLGRVRKERVGAHFLEREAFDLFVAAMSIGVENMKKRAIRTSLTLLTIILIVMSLVSLTSVIPVPKIIEVNYASASKYPGILIQSQYNEPLDIRIVQVVKEIVGDRGYISVRYWLYPPLTTENFILGGKKGTYITFKAVVGLSAVEIKKDFANVSLYLDPNLVDLPSSCILPKSIAQLLGVNVGDTVRFSGYTLNVAGIYDDSLALKTIGDIDEETGKPIYFGPRPYDVVKMNDEQRFDKLFRLSWSEIIVINSEFMKNMPGAFIPSIKVILKDNLNETTVRTMAREIFSTYKKIEVYGSYKGKGFLLSSRFVQEFFGFSFIITPVIIAGLVLATTILSNVQERTKEISIYSSLGLAPLHVAGMFLAETLAYGILGSIVGYVGGIIMARIFNFALLTGGMIGMNYSSSSVFASIGLVFALILLASLYPFFLVSKLVTPSLERRWRISTKPRGDLWEIPLPFTFREDHLVEGLAMFLSEFMETHKVERAGGFSTISYQVGIKRGESAIIKGKVWLPPFEQNIIQEFQIIFKKSLTENKYVTQLLVKRVSGPYDAWVTSAESFARIIRKQFLTWRLLTPEDRNKYIKEAEKFIGV